MPPRASIVIVTCRRGRELGRCLASLAEHLREPGCPAAEVLTVHAPGDDEVRAMVEQRFPWVRALASPVRNISAQRNHGARQARGEILVYLDDDAWPESGWLRALVSAFDDPQVLAAGGRVLRADGSQQYGPMAVTAMARPYPVESSEDLPAGVAPTIPGCNLAVRRQALFEVGGFDENLAYHFDDVELCLRLFAHAGFRQQALRYEAAALIRHEPAPGPYRRTLWNRAWFTVAKNSIYVAFRHGRRTPLRMLVVPGLLQLPKAGRFFVWLGTARLGPVAFVRCLCGHAAGVVAGYCKGLFAKPRLPLRPEQVPPAGDTGAVAEQETPCKVPQEV